MTTSSIPWKENAARTISPRIARKRSRPGWPGTNPRVLNAPGCFQYYDAIISHCDFFFFSNIVTYSKSDTIMVGSSAQVNDKASKDKTNDEGDLDNRKDKFGYRMFTIWGWRTRDEWRCKTHTFSKVTHTKDIDQTDENADDRGVERDVFCLRGSELPSGKQCRLH